MGKNVLILTGSPRIGGNTDRLAESFAKGAKEAGHNVKTFAAGRADIKPCKACNACSMRELCLPGLEKTGSVKTYMHQMLEEDG